MPRVTHILFDFFGTLVTYVDRLEEREFARSHDLVRSLGADLSYPEFLVAWSSASAHFEQLSAADHREHAMADIAQTFLGKALGRAPADVEVDLLVRTFLSEWNEGVCPVAGIADLLTGLAAEYRLAVVSNTQDAILVPDHLRAMEVRHLFDAVTTSMEVGWRKPNPRIYAAALRELDLDAVNAVFVGDSYIADYVGPSEFGIRSFLIDPQREAPVPEEARLASVLELPARLERARRDGALR